MQNKSKAEVLLLIGALKAVLDIPPNPASRNALNTIRVKLESWAYENLLDVDIPGVFKIQKIGVEKEIFV